MSRVAKNKGRLGQQEIRDRLLKEFPEFEPDDIKSTIMGDSGADIQLSPAARRKLNIAVEVKRRKAAGKTFYDFLEQANNHVSKGEDPVVFFRADRKDWLVILDIDTYMKMLKSVANGK
jgi:hypothetical protein